MPLEREALLPRAFRVCLVVALVVVGLPMKARLKMLVNSARRLNVKRSLMAQVRPKLKFSTGRRWLRKSL